MIGPIGVEESGWGIKLKWEVSGREGATGVGELTYSSLVVIRADSLSVEGRGGVLSRLIAVCFFLPLEHVQDGGGLSTFPRVHGRGKGAQPRVLTGIKKFHLCGMT
jgi:hypothetical protein